MRASGVLLPVFSLPGKYGIGCFSKEAYRFVDSLREADQKYWQILPLGPTSYGDSPYQSFSTFAGNPYFIDLDTLVEEKLLTKKEIAAADFGSSDTAVDYEKLYHNRFPLLRKAYERSRINDREDFHRFLQANEGWVYDYALFMALKDFFGGQSFDTWPEDIRRRYGFALDYYREKLYFEIEFYEFLQFEFDCQWKKLRQYANENGIQIIGDIPIYVAYDSADVWAHPELFRMDETGRPSSVAGCPPDGFSADGQLWGNPLYRWEYHAQTGFAWWIDRIAKCRELYDIIRIDHFRGFDEYFSIPAGDETAVNGHWEKGPGIELFRTIDRRFPGTRIIAEDLGYITDTVRQLVKDSGYPNMKVLEFAFDSRDSSGPREYLPYCYGTNCVAYTGTHDNETILGWLESILPEEVQNVRDYLGMPASASNRELAAGLIRIAMSSHADTCIIPLQDYMGLGNEARINMPSTLGTNWKWRYTGKQLTKEICATMKALTRIYGR